MVRIRNFLILFIVLSCLVLPPMHVQSNTQGSGSVTITVSTLNVRDGAGLGHSIIAQAKQNQTFPLLQVKDNWVQILLNDNQKGWVASWHVEMTQAETSSSTLVTPTIEVLNVRSGPSTSFQVIEQIANTQSFVRLDVQGDWVKIKLKNGAEGWTAGWLTKEVSGNGSGSPAKSSPAPSLPKATVNGSNVNVRTGPDTANPVAGQVQSGDTLIVLEEKGDWLRIKKEGLEGWVANWLVNRETPGSSDPPPSAASNKPTVKILNPGTNLRSGPATSNGVVKIANEGESYQVLGVEGDWFRIRISSDQVGYVAGWIVSAQGIANVERKGIESVLKGKTILVDPGHGGNDSGAIGPHLGTLEKQINLKVSELLGSKLRAAGAKVVFSRENDRKISLQERVNVSINKQVDAFISVHHNTSENYRINGVITYFYSNGEDRSLANAIQKEVVKRTGLTDLKARYGDYFVLRENPQLAVLCELGFLTNYQEEVILNTNNFQDQAAEGIFQGILKYFEKK
ncbi:SH3 domain-containing protein [Ammoniphilus sp. 3BR4]|uniref:SH3 domain-containing protein n=1 Tax=Ammoniphilus sp. 3BR4 TaxID=3158265 RepID=UPI003465D5D0